VVKVADLAKKGVDVEEMIVSELQRRSKDDFLAFQQLLIIPSAYGPQRMFKCQTPFQKEAFEALSPSLIDVKAGKIPKRKHFWIERTKKASKDADLAICILWLMYSCTNPFLAQICASDSKQAKIIRDRCMEVMHFNPWLNKTVEVIEDQVRNRTNPRTVRTLIESTGSAGDAQGPTPDLLILNELVHVERWDTIMAHMANATGVPRNVMIIATNAGIKGSPADGLRTQIFKTAKRNPDGYYIQVFKERAPWVSEEDVETLRSTDPTGKETDRLYRGKWISGLGDALDEKDIENMFVLDGPTEETKPGWFCLIGLDMGETNDHAGLVALGVNIEENQMEVWKHKSLKPSIPNEQGKLEVNAEEVQLTTLDWSRKYNACWVGYDPAAGGRFIAQWLRRHGVVMCEMAFGNSSNLIDMATCLTQAVKGTRLKAYDDDSGTLRRDIGKFSIERTARGIKLTATRDSYGHADVGTALVICLPQAFELMGWGDNYQNNMPLTEENTKPLSQQELDSMDPDMRALYELDWTK